MSGKLQAATNATLGFLGLNTQEAGVTLESGYATKALNCIIDKSGRLGSRRGWTKLTTPTKVTGTISTTTLTVSSLTLGNLSVGVTLSGPGITTGTTITALGSGIGGAGTYTISPSQTVTLAGTYSRTLTTVTVTATAHGLVVGDTVYLDFTTGTAVDGAFVVTTTPTANTFTVTHGTSGSTSGNVTIGRPITATYTLGSSDYIESMFEFIDTDRTITILSAGGGKLYSGTDALAQRFVNGAESGGVSTPLSPQPTFTGNRWQFAQLAEGAGIGALMYGFAAQKGNELLIYRRMNHSGAYVFQKIGSGYGTRPSGVTTFDPDCVLSAFGRIWTANITGATSTIYYSKLLDGNAFTGAGSGLVDVASVVGNNDEIVGLASHNGFLVVFCRNNIVIYQNPDSPTTTAFALQDVITGVGCIGRDTIQNTGTDLIFMSKSGLRSLNRVVNEKSAPMRDLSANIRDDLIGYINGENENNIKSIYFERDAFYLLMLPALGQIIYFDLRQQLPNGAARATIWTDIKPKAFLATSTKTLLLGMPGGVGNYTGYSDNGSTYRLEYFTQNTDFGAPFALKLLKKAKIIMIASGSQDIILKYGFDYNTYYSPRTYTKDFIGANSEYNIAEYNIGEYTSGIAIAEVDLNLGGSGKILQFGIEATIDSTPVSLQQMTVYVKLGKTV